MILRRSKRDTSKGHRFGEKEKSVKTTKPPNPPHLGLFSLTHSWMANTAERTNFGWAFAGVEGENGMVQREFGAGHVFEK